MCAARQAPRSVGKRKGLSPMLPTPAVDATEERLDADAEASSTALVVAVARGAPAPNEPTSSADEAEDEAQDDEWIWVGNQRRRVVAPTVRIGGWAVIHGLRNERVLNGLLVRCCPDKPEDPDDSDRVRVELVEESQRGQQKRVRRLNLQGVGPEEAIGRLLIAWLESGPSTRVFAVPAWAALAHDEALRKTERVEIDHLEGRITVGLVTPYPPGIPLLIPGEVFNKKIVDYLKFAREFNAQCPGFETDIHGLVEEADADGKLRYFADCVRAA